MDWLWIEVNLDLNLPIWFQSLDLFWTQIWLWLQFGFGFTSSTNPHMWLADGDSLMCYIFMAVLHVEDVLVIFSMGIKACSVVNIRPFSIMYIKVKHYAINQMGHSSNVLKKRAWTDMQTDTHVYL